MTPFFSLFGKFEYKNKNISFTYNMAEHNKLGKEGEMRAENYLIAKGHRIIERNWHSTHKELDLITEQEGWLVIVEVKTRTGRTWEPPENAVNAAKIKHIALAAHHYVRMHHID